MMFLSIVQLIKIMILLLRQIQDASTIAQSAYSVYPELKTVVGNNAQLACNITSSPDDAIQLILWYKSSSGTGSPFYTIDARNAASLNQSKHFQLDSYKERIRFNVSVQTALLILDSVQEQDAGEYSCRVDFKWSRTSISVIKLYVVVPPKDVIVVDDDSGIRLHTIAGPYKEGSDLKLNCIAVGGKPPPKLVWYFDNQMIDDSYSLDNSSGHIVNELFLKNLKRDFLNSVLNCKADSHHSLPSISASLRLDIYLKPSTVSILTKNEKLRVGKKLDISCVTNGSKPVAELSWILNQNERLKDFRTTHSRDGTLTNSTLSYMPAPHHHGSVLYCIAKNPHLPNTSINDSWTLNVFSRPRVNLSLNSNESGLFAVEGKQAQLKCNITSNPPVLEIHWLYENKVLTNDSIKGITINNDTLVLQLVEKWHKGDYECIARNSEGKARSGTFHLDVYYLPKCITGDTHSFELEVGGSANVSCEVDAFPANVSYQWQFLTKRGGGNGRPFEIYKNQSFHNDKVMSVSEFGTLFCKATNALGSSKSPCRYDFRPAKTTPKSPKECQLLVNRSEGFYQITCQPPELDNAGQTQTFYLELFDAERRLLIFRLKESQYPKFTVSQHDLIANQTYLFVIYAENQNGRSPEVVLSTEPQMMRSKADNPAVTPTEVPIIFVVTTIVICVLLSLVVLKSFKLVLRHLRGRRLNSEVGHNRVKVVDSQTPDVIPLSVDTLEHTVFNSKGKGQPSDRRLYLSDLGLASMSNKSEYNIFTESKLLTHNSMEKSLFTSFSTLLVEHDHKDTDHVFLPDDVHERLDGSFSISTTV